MKGSKGVHHKVDLPRFEFEKQNGREIFATWKPFYDPIESAYASISNEFVTDANGLELINRTVWKGSED